MCGDIYVCVTYVGGWDRVWYGMGTYGSGMNLPSHRYLCVCVCAVQCIIEGGIEDGGGGSGGGCMKSRV